MLTEKKLQEKKNELNTEHLMGFIEWEENRKMEYGGTDIIRYRLTERSKEKAVLSVGFDGVMYPILVVDREN